MISKKSLLMLYGDHAYGPAAYFPITHTSPDNESQIPIQDL